MKGYILDILLETRTLRAQGEIHVQALTPGHLGEVARTLEDRGWRVEVREAPDPTLAGKMGVDRIGGDHGGDGVL